MFLEDYKGRRNSFIKMFPSKISVIHPMQALHVSIDLVKVLYLYVSSHTVRNLNLSKVISDFIWLIKTIKCCNQRHKNASTFLPFKSKFLIRFPLSQHLIVEKLWMIFHLNFYHFQNLPKIKKRRLGDCGGLLFLIKKFLRVQCPKLLYLWIIFLANYIHW